jgi:Txe/YoeB family toxin of Txe-Axe toxin-antitoxin module
MELIPLTDKQQKYLKRYNLAKKFQKQINLFFDNPSHPSLNVEKVYSVGPGLYSFRIDKKYRAIFAISKGVIKIIALTNHYH